MFWVWDRRATLSAEMEIMRFFVLSMMLCVACGTPKDEESDEEWDNDGSSTDAGGPSADGGTDGGGTDADGGGTDSDGGGTDASGGSDMTTGRFLGQMNAETYTVYEAGEVEGVDFDAGSNWGLCSGGVAFDLADNMKFQGEAGCSSYIDPNFEPEDPSIDPNEQAPYTINFDLSGSQSDGVIEGVLVFEAQGEEIETPFTGTRVGAEIEASFDHVHGEGGNRFEISGTLTATWVE